MWCWSEQPMENTLKILNNKVAFSTEGALHSPCSLWHDQRNTPHLWQIYEENKPSRKGTQQYQPLPGLTCDYHLAWLILHYMGPDIEDQCHTQLFHPHINSLPALQNRSELILVNHSWWLKETWAVQESLRKGDIQQLQNTVQVKLNFGNIFNPVGSWLKNGETSCVGAGTFPKWTEISHELKY